MTSQLLSFQVTFLKLCKIILLAFSTAPFTPACAEATLAQKLVPRARRAPPGEPSTSRVWSRQIRCIGPVPRELLPENTAAGPRDIHRSARSLCAGDLYGGTLNHNVGGYCSTVYGNPIVRFDTYVPSGVHEYRGSEFFYGKLYDTLAFCKLRCRCLRHPSSSGPSRLNVVAQEIRNSEPPDPLLYDRNPLMMIQSSDIEQPLPSPQNKLQIPVGLETDARMRIVVLFCPADEVYPIVRGMEDVPPTKPRCLNEFPMFLPHPFTRADFRNTEMLCSSVFAGGSVRGNVGGVCSPIDMDGDDDVNRVYSQFKIKSIFAHPSFLSSNGYIGLSVWLWCYSICTCDSRENLAQKKAVAIPVWKDRNIYAHFRNGLVYPSLKDGTPPPPGIPNVLIPSSSETITPSRKRRACDVVDEDGFCFEEPLPLDSCNRECTSNAQCGGDCRCVALPDKTTLQRAGYDLSWSTFAATCVTFALVESSSSSIRERLPLGRRTFDGLACACNATYISEACCRSESGTIWEPSDMKLGEIPGFDQVSID